MTLGRCQRLFEDRFGLLKAVIERSLGPLHLQEVEHGADVRTVVTTMSESIETFLTGSLDVLIAAQSDAELRDALHAYMLENDFGPHRGIAAYITAQQSTGALRDDIDAKVVASMIVNDAFQRASVPKLVGHRKGIQPRTAFVDSLLAMISK